MIRRFTAFDRCKLFICITRIAVILGFTGSAAACFTALSAPPDRVVPVFDAMEAQPGPASGRVVLDTEHRRCRVRLAPGHRTESGARILEDRFDPGQVLCVTPCQIELPLGVHRLRFCEWNDFNVTVSPQPTVFRARLLGPRFYSHGEAVQWPLGSPEAPWTGETPRP